MVTVWRDRRRQTTPAFTYPHPYPTTHTPGLLCLPHPCDTPLPHPLLDSELLPAHTPPPPHYPIYPLPHCNYPCAPPHGPTPLPYRARRAGYHLCFSVHFHLIFTRGLFLSVLYGWLVVVLRGMVLPSRYPPFCHRACLRALLVMPSACTRLGRCSFLTGIATIGYCWFLVGLPAYYGRPGVRYARFRP